MSRLTGRQIRPVDGETSKEEYHFDGLNRLVSAIANGVTILRRFDTLSRLQEETQAGRILQYEYDAPGNQTLVRHPSGREVRYEYDVLKRITGVTDGDGRRLAHYDYRSSGQVLRQQLGDAVEASFAYSPCQGQVREVVYRSRDGEVVEGSRYEFDVVRNRTQEAQLHRGENYGERYFYDTRNRLVGVQYGVQNLDDDNSSFEQEVRFDLDAMGGWQNRRVLDGQGQVVAEAEGLLLPRHALESLGDHTFRYDRNGNRVGERNGEVETRRYTYDYANRPTRVEELDAQGNVSGVVEYGYDAFSRQVLRRVTDGQGNAQESAQVWNGRRLVEEWYQDNPARSYVYGARGEPVEMIIDSREIFPAYNARGLTTALINGDGQALERYRYDSSGHPFQAESRIPTDLFAANGPASRVGNRFFGGLWDDDLRAVLNPDNLRGLFDARTGQRTNSEAGGGEIGCHNRFQDPRGKAGMDFSIDLEMSDAAAAGLVVAGAALFVASAGTATPLSVALVGTAVAGGAMGAGAACLAGHCEGDENGEGEGGGDSDGDGGDGGAGPTCGGGGGGGGQSKAGILFDPSIAFGAGGDDTGTGDGDDGSGGDGSGGDSDGDGSGGGDDDESGGEGGSSGGEDGDEDGEEGEGGGGGEGGCDGGGGKSGIAGLTPGEGGGPLDYPDVLRHGRRRQTSEPPVDGGGGGGGRDSLGGCAGGSGGAGSSSRGGCGSGHSPNTQMVEIRRGACPSGPGHIDGIHGHIPSGGAMSRYARCAFPAPVVNPGDNMGAMGARSDGSLGCIPDGAYSGSGGTGRQGGDDPDCRVMGPADPQSCGGENRDPRAEMSPGSCGGGDGGGAKAGRYLREQMRRRRPPQQEKTPQNEWACKIT